MHTLFDTLKSSALSGTDTTARPSASPFEEDPRGSGRLDIDCMTQRRLDGRAAPSDDGSPAFSDGPAAPTGGRLENIGDNSSAPRMPRRGKWDELDWLRVNSTLKSQRNCLLGTVGKTVGVRVSSVGAGFSGLMHCGRVACPNCGPRIGAVRRDEINRALENHRATGGRVLFGTFTLRHHLGQTFAELSAALSLCWSAATGGRGWVSERNQHRIRHSLRVWEEKWSLETGWHLHVHFLLFIEAEPHGSTTPPGSVAASVVPSRRLLPPQNAGPDCAALLAGMFGRWQRKALAMGLSAPLLIGQDLHEVTGDDVDVLGGYFAKQAEDMGRSDSESMAWELSNPNGKASGVSFTPAEIRSLAVGGDPEMAVLWAEYEQGMINRRTIAWSRRALELLGVGEEKSDQAIVDESDGGDVVLSMSSKTWWKFCRIPGNRFELLRLVQSAGAEAAVNWARSIGFTVHLGDIGAEQ